MSIKINSNIAHGKYHNIMNNIEHNRLAFVESKATNYPYLAGGFQALISGLAYSLVSKGIVGYDKYDELKAYFEGEIDRIKQAERNS